MIWKSIVAIVAVVVSAVLGSVVSGIMHERQQSADYNVSQNDELIAALGEIAKSEYGGNVRFVLVNYLQPGCGTWHKLEQAEKSIKGDWEMVVVLHPSYTKKDVERAQHNFQFNYPNMILDTDHMDWWNELEKQGIFIDGVQVDVPESGDTNVHVS